MCFFNPLRIPARKSVCPLVRGGSVAVGVLQVFVGNCIIKRFSQRPITTHFYAEVCGCRCLNHQRLDAKLGILCLALNDAELQGSTTILLVVGLGDSVLAGGNSKLWCSSFRWSHRHSWWWWGGNGNVDLVHCDFQVKKTKWHHSVWLTSRSLPCICRVWEVMKKIVLWLPDALLLLRAEEFLKLNFTVVSCKLISAYEYSMWGMGRNISD